MSDPALQELVDTAEALALRLRVLEGRLRRARIVALVSVLLLLSIPLVLAFVPLHMRRVVVRELVVDSGHDSKIVADLDGDTARLQIFRGEKAQVALSSSPEENRLDVNGWGNPGVSLVSRESGALLSLKSDAEPGNGVFIESKSGEGTFRIARLGEELQLGGARPGIALKGKRGSLVASIDAFPEIRMKNERGTTAVLSAGEDGAFLSLKDYNSASLRAGPASAKLEFDAGKYGSSTLEAGKDGSIVTLRNQDATLVLDKHGVKKGDK